MSQGFPFDHFINNKKPSIFDNLKKKSTNNSPETQNSMFSTKSTSEVAKTAGSNPLVEMLNSTIHEQLKSNLTIDNYNAFFGKNLKITAASGEEITIEVKTAFIKNLVETQYNQLLNDTVAATLGSPVALNIIVSSSNSNDLESKPAVSTQTKSNDFNLTSLLDNKDENNTNKKIKDVTFKLDLTPKSDDLENKVESKYLNHVNQANQQSSVIDQSKTFDHFVVGPSNNMAFATAVAVANDPGRSGKYPSLYIYSDSGLGKTHLLHAVGNGIREKAPEMVICLITARDFMKEMVNAIKNKTLDSFQKKYSERIDVLMIDDIHELNNKQGTQNEFFHIFNELYNKGKQLIFTSDKAPHEIEGIEERIKTRLQWGLVIDIQKPDLETRLAILRKKANELDLYLPDDAYNLIASSVKSSIRELEGTLIRLSAFSDVMKVDVDSEMVRELLKLSNQDEKKITLESLAKAVSNHYKVPIADMKSKSRSKSITVPRHVAMYLSRKILSATQQEIARFYGGRDHSTVIHAIRAITEKMKTDRELSKSIIEIESML
ncbi:MAG: chromosomal replication initiator protein DnaA [Bacteriovoracaceae bacterium]